MPNWSFTESFVGEEGAREEETVFSRDVAEDIQDQLWFLTRVLELSTGSPVRQLSVSFEEGKTYSTEL